MDTLWDQRVLCWIERVVLTLAIAYLGFHSLPRAWSKLNTDFPNYYTMARLAHEGYDTSRAYEWIWIQREKDHRSLDIPAIGMIPLTPFSALTMWPLTTLPALVAKHIWIITDFALLVPLGWLIHSLIGLSYQRIALVVALSFPFQRNLLFGQYYVFLLVLLVAACLCYVKEHYVLSGSLVAIAAASKIFPVLLVVLFLRRRNWRALASCAVAGIGTACASIAVFGWNVNRTYLFQILPGALHGEAVDPYIPSGASISNLLHYLLLAEPQWNPHPWHDSPLLFSVLHPVLQMLLFAPMILLIRRDDRTPRRIILEWIGMLTAALTISTEASSYHFVLMVFPACVLAALLLKDRRYIWLIGLAVAYLGIGFPMPTPTHPMGPAVLFFAPRLFLMIAVLIGIYFLLWRDLPGSDRIANWEQYVWICIMVLAVPVTIHSTFQREHAVREEYAYRVPVTTQFLYNGDPVGLRSAAKYIAGSAGGYRLISSGSTPNIDVSPDDELSFSAVPGQTLVEKARSGISEIVDPLNPQKTIVEDARNPMLSEDAQDLAFVRDDHGRGQLMLSKSFQSGQPAESVLTPSSINVYDATFLSPKDYAVSATEGRGPTQIYLNDSKHNNSRLDLGVSRYPALSPDGRWMAFSHLERGVWNLWIRDEDTGATSRVADAPCNQVQPSWEADSKTLLYADDCGRSVWVTAIARRQVIP